MRISENYPVLYINMYKSYFRRVNKNCKARNKMEWPQNEQNNIDTMYGGDHNHKALFDRSENEKAGIAANQYDLATQMFGSART
ncbi:hypothetical protein MA16_Dca017875 [Dendrobium catenatum]|uniref:WRKY domain-containing protein n=1 Tax=Dendrobium catenatum TaxID=906689 RepID=A0A2I0W9P5_9ASPA|nr:hypothetical protein MA16_Dca017875 [Dendrobium catenatum]